MTKPLVSIIINNYNYGRFLKDAIESALSQTYSNKEVIVVDDGSKDNSLQVLDSYKGAVKMLSKENGGQGSAFNEAYTISKGEFVCFLDSDDILLPSAIEHAVKEFEVNEAVKVHWQLIVIDEAGKRTGDLLPANVPPSGDLKERVILEGPFYDWYHTPPTSGNLWKSDFLKRVLPMPVQPFRIGADEYLHTLAPVYGHVQTLSEPLSCYRIHGKNNCFGSKFDNDTIQSFKERFEACCDALHKHFKSVGLTTSTTTWKKKNFNYLWLERLSLARVDVFANIPNDATAILIDGNELGEGFCSSLRIIPLKHKEGEYWGLPENDAEAIQELKEHQESGISYIIFWWTSFWWFNQYPKFHNHLVQSFNCILNNDRLVVFNLRGKD